MSLKHFLTKHVYNVVRTTITKKDYISSNWKKIRENKLNLKIGWVNYGKKSACFASPISRSPPLNRHVSSQRSLIFKRAHNTNQLSLCLDAGRLCHSRPVRRVIAICKLQTPAEVRFWDQKLSYCHTSGLLLHNLISSRFCVNRSCLMRVFLQKFIFKQHATPSAESFFWPLFHFEFTVLRKASINI